LGRQKTLQRKGVKRERKRGRGRIHYSHRTERRCDWPDRYTLGIANSKEKKGGPAQRPKPGLSSKKKKTKKGKRGGGKVWEGREEKGNVAQNGIQVSSERRNDAKVSKGHPKKKKKKTITFWIDLKRKNARKQAEIHTSAETRGKARARWNRSPTTRIESDGSARNETTIFFSMIRQRVSEKRREMTGT